MSLSIFDEPKHEGPFTILTVCTGNICRSPLAESLLSTVLRDLPIVVRSAGTAAMVDHQMTPEMQRIAADLGVAAPEQHRARQLTAELARGADLILALTRDHRRAVVEMLPKATKYTFTLREFGRISDQITAQDLELATGDGVTRLHTVTDLASQLRGTLIPLDDPAHEDVIDPYRQTDDIYRQSTEQIVPAINQISTLLRSAARGDTPW